MKNSLFILLFFTLFVSAITLAYKAASPYIAPANEVSVETSRDGGIFVSSDGGNTWEQQTRTDGGGNLSRSNVFALVFDPTDARIVYAGTSVGLYRYVNEEKIWRRLGAGSLPDAVQVTSLTVQSQNPSVLFAAVKRQGQEEAASIWKSSDGGNMFTQVYASSLRGEKVVDIVSDFYDANIVMALTDKNIFLRSDDGGNSWRSTYTFSGAAAKGLAVDPNDSRNVYIFSSQGFFKSSTKGLSWQDGTSALSSFPAEARNINDLRVQTGNSSLLYAATDYGILRSNNGGAGFQTVSFLVPPGGAQILSLGGGRSESHLWAGVGTNLYWTSDSGRSWEVRALPTDRPIGEIAPHPFDGSHVFIGVRRGVL